MRNTRVVPLQCTCGAALPEDARFCHKCGKPQYEEDLAREQVEIVTPAQSPVEPPTALKIDFSNRLAVVTTLLVSGIMLFALNLLSVVIPVPIWPPLLFSGSGFLAVLLYTRRSGQTVSPRSGARIGWMTGVWSFLVLTVLAGLVALLVISSAEVRDTIQNQILASANESTRQQLTDIFQKPGEFVTRLVLSLLVMVGLATIGGWLGAKFLQRSRHSV